MARHGAWRQVKGFLAVLQRTSASRFHDRRRLAVHFVEIIHASRMTPDLPSGGVGRARFWCDDLSKTSYQDGASTSRRVWRERQTAGGETLVGVNIPSKAGPSVPALAMPRSFCRRRAPPICVNRRTNLTPDRRPKLTASGGIGFHASVRPGAAGRGCVAGARAVA